MEHRWRVALAAAAAGAVNGLFGGGGGMVLLPLLTGEDELRGRALFASCVAVIFPVCLVSAAISVGAGDFPFREALPFLLGGAAGGAAGGKLFRKLPPVWLKRLFALFLLYAGVKYLL